MREDKETRRTEETYEDPFKDETVWFAMEDYAGRLAHIPGSKAKEWQAEQEELRRKMERGEIPDPRTYVPPEIEEINRRFRERRAKRLAEEQQAKQTEA